MFKSAKKVLFIAYHYPPRGGVAVLRTIKFLKYLSRLGWQSKVLTLQTGRYVVRDESLQAEVPSDIAVCRVFDPGPLINRVAARIKSGMRLGFPDVESWWVPAAAFMAVAIIVKHKIPLIYSTSPPHSTHLVAYLAKVITGASWVADFRDTWAGNPFFIKPGGWRKKLIEWLEKKVVKRADVIVLNTLQAQNDFKERYPTLAEKFVWLPNGYDPDNFQEMTDTRPTRDKLTLTYVGSMGGGRPLDFFFQALKNLIYKNPAVRHQIEIVLVGMVSVQAKRMAKKLGLEEQIVFTGHLSHKEAIQYMFNSDVLLLFQFAGHGGATALPSKVFEYMRAKKVIFAQTCAGPTADIVRQYPGGYVVEPTDVESITAVLAQLYEMFDKQILTEVEAENIEQFSRIALTKQLHTIFMRTLALPNNGTNK